MAGGKIFLEPILNEYVGSVGASLAGLKTSVDLVPDKIDQQIAQFGETIGAVKSSVDLVPGKIDQQITKLQEVVNAMYATGTAPNIKAGTSITVPLNLSETKIVSIDNMNPYEIVDRSNKLLFFNAKGTVIINCTVQIVQHRGYVSLESLYIYKNDTLMTVMPGSTTQFTVPINLGDRVSIGGLFGGSSGSNSNASVTYTLQSASYDYTQSTDPNVVVSGI